MWLYLWRWLTLVTELSLSLSIETPQRCTVTHSTAKARCRSFWTMLHVLAVRPTSLTVATTSLVKTTAATAKMSGSTVCQPYPRSKQENLCSSSCLVINCLLVMCSHKTCIQHLTSVSHVAVQWLSQNIDRQDNYWFSISFGVQDLSVTYKVCRTSSYFRQL